MSTVIDAYTQKLWIVSIDEVAPETKASEFVSEVIVMAGPECLKAFAKRSFGLKRNET